VEFDGGSASPSRWRLPFSRPAKALTDDRGDRRNRGHDDQNVRDPPSRFAAKDQEQKGNEQQNAATATNQKRRPLSHDPSFPTLSQVQSQRKQTDGPDKAEFSDLYDRVDPFMARLSR
jgi:hypothetical protein